LFFYSTFVHVTTILYLRRKIQPSWEFYQLLIYPAIILLSNALSFIAKFFSQFGSGNYTILLSVAAFFLYSQGFFDALVYASNYSVRTVIRTRMKLFCSGQDQITQNSRTTSSLLTFSVDSQKDGTSSLIDQKNVRGFTETSRATKDSSEKPRNIRH